MRVAEKRYGKETVYEFEDLLASTIQGHDSERGTIEDLQMQVRVLAHAVGKLLVLACEKRPVGIEEVYEICGGYNSIRIVK